MCILLPSINSSDVIPLLIKVETDLYTTTEYDDALMMIARRHGYKEIIEVLRQFYGMKVNHETKQYR